MLCEYRKEGIDSTRVLISGVKREIYPGDMEGTVFRARKQRLAIIAVETTIRWMWGGSIPEAKKIFEVIIVESAFQRRRKDSHLPSSSRHRGSRGRRGSSRGSSVALKS